MYSNVAKSTNKSFYSSQDFSGFSQIITGCASSYTRLENSDLYSVLGLEAILFLLMRWCVTMVMRVRVTVKVMVEGDGKSEGL